MSSRICLAQALADWALDHVAGDDDLALARRSLHDTVAVTLAARRHPVNAVSTPFADAGRWAAAAHVLDFDDLHMESTAHISVVCVPAVASVGGGARAYLAAAGVMARLGMILGWGHYAAGWHATCTAGAPAAAAGVAVALGLDRDAVAHAIALAVPGAGGVQRAFGTDGKSLQVAAAVETGIRAGRLAAAGARGDLGALDEWCALVGGERDAVDVWAETPSVPGGLAIKLYPCCYALQRPIHAVAQVAGRLDAADVRQVTVRTPAATLAPLIHHRPATGLQGKFSLEYAIATALLDEHQGFESFTDAAVLRPEAQRLIAAVRVESAPGGSGLLDGVFEAVLQCADGSTVRCAERLPPGAPARPPSDAELAAKLRDCLGDEHTNGDDAARWSWASAAELVRNAISPAGAPSPRQSTI